MWFEVEELIETAHQRNLFAGCSLSIHALDGIIYEKSFGNAQTVPYSREANGETQWDLASLTKILFTAPLCLKLVSRGVLDLDKDIQHVIPSAPKGVTPRLLLMHKSGYPAWFPFYKDCLSGNDWRTGAFKEKVQVNALSSPMVEEPGAKSIYSDVGFIVLGLYLERLTNQSLFDLWCDELPSEAKGGLTWAPENAAATEKCPVRKKVIVGEVHDLNAACMGGVSTHAGLFGTANAACYSALWPMRNLKRLRHDVPPEVVRHFWQTEQVGQHCLGWDTPSVKGSSASSKWPSNGIGHLGFTGCSIWLAPTQGVGVTFCSNRVHPTVEGGSVPNAPPHPRLIAFKAFRPRLHQLVLSELRHLGFEFNV